MTSSLVVTTPLFALWISGKLQQTIESTVIILAIPYHFV